MDGHTAAGSHMCAFTSNFLYFILFIYNFRMKYDCFAVFLMVPAARSIIVIIFDYYLWAFDSISFGIASHSYSYVVHTVAHHKHNSMINHWNWIVPQLRSLVNIMR